MVIPLLFSSNQSKIAFERCCIAIIIIASKIVNSHFIALQHESGARLPHVGRRKKRHASALKHLNNLPDVDFGCGFFSDAQIWPGPFTLPQPQCRHSRMCDRNETVGTDRPDTDAGRIALSPAASWRFVSTSGSVAPFGA
jgi:hypothetical protein